MKPIIAILLVIAVAGGALALNLHWTPSPDFFLFIMIGFLLGMRALAR